MGQGKNRGLELGLGFAALPGWGWGHSWRNPVVGIFYGKSYDQLCKLL